MSQKLKYSELEAKNKTLTQKNKKLQADKTTLLDLLEKMMKDL